MTTGSGGFWGLVWLAARMALFLALAVAFGLWVLPFLVRWVGRLSISQGLLALAIVSLLVYGLAAEVVGQMAALIGAFLAGLMFARTPQKGQIEQGMIALAYGLFVPVFFVNIGLSIDLRSLQLNALWLIMVVTLAAIAGKIFGAFAGARLGGLPVRESFQLGAGMVARGEVTLIVAAAGSKAGLVDGAAFSAIVAAVLLSTLVTPALLRFSITRFDPEAAAVHGQALGREGGEFDMKMILFVLNDPTRLLDLLNAWQEAGAKRCHGLLQHGHGPHPPIPVPARGSAVDALVERFLRAE